jgi:hypothetical protein
MMQVTPHRHFITEAVLCLLLGFAGCSESRDAPPGASSLEAAGKTFTSERQGYRMDVPQGWSTHQAYLDWTMGVEPHRDGPFFDTLRSEKTGDPWVLVGRQEFARSLTLHRWVARLRSSDTITYPGRCDPPAFERPSTLGGEPAQMIALRCPGDFPNSIAIQVLGVHDRAGYLVMCFSEEAEGGRIKVLLDDCEEWLSSFRFVD